MIDYFVWLSKLACNVYKNPRMKRSGSVIVIKSISIVDESMICFWETCARQAIKVKTRTKDRNAWIGVE